MPGRFNPAKEKPKVQLLCPSAGGVLRSEEGGVYVPVTPVRHFNKPRSAHHVLQPIDKAHKRRFFKKVRRGIFQKPAPAPIVPYRHKLPAPAVAVTYEQLQKRAEEQREREYRAKQQHIRQELVKRLNQAKQPVSGVPRVGTAVSAARWLPLCCGAWVPCDIRYSSYSDSIRSDSSVSSVCSPGVADDCESKC